MLFSATGVQTAAGKTALVITSTATVRPCIISAEYSNVGAISVDSNYQFQGKFFTAAGTTTAVTPTNKQQGGPAATFTAGSNATVEPTYTAGTSFMDNGYNPRGTFKWNAVEQRDEIELAAVAASGAGWFLNVLGGAVSPQVTATIRQ